MRFEWDEDKNRENVRKHGFDFADAWQVFIGAMLVVFDDRQEYGEDRWIGIGLLGEPVVVVVYTEAEDETVRIVSMRKATSHERKGFEQYLKDQLGPD